MEMRPRWIQMALAVVSANQETARSAGRVQYRIVCFMNTKGVNQVHRIIAGEMLTVPVSLLRPNELLEDAPHHIGGHLAEINGFNAPQQAAPGIQSANRVEDDLRGPIFGFWHQQRLIIAAPFHRPAKKAIERSNCILGRPYRRSQLEAR